MVSSSVFLFLACLHVCCVPLAEANAGFLRAGVNVEQVQVEDLDAALLAELNSAVGGDRVAAANLLRLEQALSPLYSSLPKNAHGHLEASVVRYALHRYFAQQHGWNVKGLLSTGSVANSSSAVDVLTDRVPSYVQGRFETTLGGKGFGLRELALFASTMEHLVHTETTSRLHWAYQATGFALDEPLDDQGMDLIARTYMMGYIMKRDLHLVTPKNLDIAFKFIAKKFPDWGQTDAWVKDMTRSAAYENRGSRNPFIQPGYDDAIRVIEGMGDRYGRYQDLECRSLKGALLDLEAGDTGRVPLSAFYRAGLSGKWFFNENVDYLRELGALDETDPRELRVIVPNYLNSPSNCLAGSGFYDVCCIDECHALLHQLEEKIASPTAEPARIAALVAALPSDTVDAPRNLSEPLLQRLGEIASVHGGRVPLHGRLFAQWMHHAYPREYPFPHVAGTTVPRSSAERAAAVGTSTTASQEVMEMYAATSADVAAYISITSCEAVVLVPTVAARSAEDRGTVVPAT